jgi:hypothetical protein
VNVRKPRPLDLSPVRVSRRRRERCFGGFPVTVARARVFHSQAGTRDVRGVVLPSGADRAGNRGFAVNGPVSQDRCLCGRQRRALVGLVAGCVDGGGNSDSPTTRAHHVTATNSKCWGSSEATTADTVPAALAIFSQLIESIGEPDVIRACGLRLRGGHDHPTSSKSRWLRAPATRKLRVIRDIQAASETTSAGGFSVSGPCPKNIRRRASASVRQLATAGHRAVPPSGETDVVPEQTAGTA